MKTNTNSFCLTGRLGGDAELNDSGSTPRGTFSLACARTVPIDGEYREITDWFRVVQFGPRATSLKSLGKGSYVLVEGRLQPSTYEKDGVQVHTVNLVADRVEFLDRREPGGASSEDGADEAAAEAA